jgi:hypothetical protein
MAEGLKNEKTAFGRLFLRAALALLFVGASVVILMQGITVKSSAQWLMYLSLFVATDQIANAVIKRIARQSHTHAGAR